jgi:hypothetical protein
METIALLKRFLAGAVGVAILFPSLIFGYRVGQGIYYDYFLFSKLKAEDHYIPPTRWQDFVFQAIFWPTILLLLFAAFRLIRFAVKPHTPSRHVQSSPRTSERQA